MENKAIDSKERASVVRAMDILARSINDEDILMEWLELGVADHYGSYANASDEELESYYDDDDMFAGLMDVFLDVMSQAKKSGGLYVDNIVSKPYES